MNLLCDWFRGGRRGTCRGVQDEPSGQGILDRSRRRREGRPDHGRRLRHRVQASAPRPSPGPSTFVVTNNGNKVEFYVYGERSVMGEVENISPASSAS